MSVRPISREIQDQIFKAVETNAEKQVQWLRRLVMFPSTRGNEAECQEWLAGEFQSREWTVDRYTLDEVAIEGLPGFSPVVGADYSKAVQVVATCKASEPAGRSLILQGHIDVVPPGALELWEHSPFEPRIVEGFMYGRGANDMKVGVTAMVFALDALKDIGYRPDADVYVETVSEEECTGNGALSTLVRGYRADACLIPESSDNTLCRAELGSVWFRLRILGAPVHVLSARDNANAILLAYEYIEALKQLTTEFNEEAKSHPWFSHIENPVRCSVGKINGGDWLGSVPAWCEIECRLSVLPGHSLESVRARVTQAVRSCAEGIDAARIPEVSWIGFQADGHVFEPGSDAEAVLAKVHEDILGAALVRTSETATSDTRQYDLYYGIPALCYGPRGTGSHSPAERADLASMVETTKIIAVFIAAWCGLKKIPT